MEMPNIMKVPWHSQDPHSVGSVHACSSKSVPMQGRPPFLGLGFEQYLDRKWVREIFNEMPILYL
jgi:hypothetical protein